METLRDIGEFEMLKRLFRFLPVPTEAAGQVEVVRGVGDDCAVIRLPGRKTDDSQGGVEWVLTSDPVVEGVHFERDAAPDGIGHKATGRVLSDIAAMGAAPACALVNVVAPAEMAVERLEAVYQSACRTASRYGLTIVGGDVAGGPVLALHVFAIGQAPQGTSVTRAGARPGQEIFVTGELGGSLQGRHLNFVPRVQEGLWLRDRAAAMIDLSDGLATDLRHILEESGVGALLDLDAIPLSEAARAADDKRAPLQHALCDGEDFELLFTVPAERRSELEREWARAFDVKCTRIGRVTKANGVVECRDEDGRTGTLDAQGFAHWVPRKD